MTYKEISRQEFESSSCTTDKIYIGCLQRIADSLENLQFPNKIIRLEQRVENLHRELEYERKSNASLRGVITKLKNKEKFRKFNERNEEG